MTAVRDRGIIFSKPSVLTTLRHLKTQTRRVVKEPAPPDATGAGCFHAPGRSYDGEWQWTNGDPKDIDSLWICDAPGFLCPYGRHGDRLYVKEALTRSGGYAQYLADLQTLRQPWPAHWTRDPQSPMFMPKRMARAWLEIVDIHIEPLLSLTEEDAAAEGIPRSPDSAHAFGFFENFLESADLDDWCWDDWLRRSRVGNYLAGWDTINPNHPASSNPFVWVLKYRLAVSVG